MIIESVDGFYYQNPRFYGKRFLVFCDEEYVICDYIGTVGEDTVQRALSKKGIKARPWDEEIKSIIIGNKIVGGTRFLLDLKKPIPIPQEYTAKLTSFEGAEECVIQFSEDCQTRTCDLMMMEI